jgi:hypothetical protein
MNIRQQVDGLNSFLTEVFGAETRLSAILKELGFSEQQVELIRTRHLECVVAKYLDSIKGRMLEWSDGERMFTVLIRRYGLDGQAPQSSADLRAPADYSHAVRAGPLFRSSEKPGCNNAVQTPADLQNN